MGISTLTKFKIRLNKNYISIKKKNVIYIFFVFSENNTKVTVYLKQHFNFFQKIVKNDLERIQLSYIG